MRRAIAFLGCTGVLLIPAASAPAASAPTATIAPLAPCYVSAGPDPAQRQQIVINASGLTPNGNATVVLDRTVILAQAQIDPMGQIAGTEPAPFQATGQRPFTLTITDNANRANTAVATSLVSALAVHVRPIDARPTSRVRFRGRGFVDGTAVYGHYLRKGKLRKTVLLAMTTGPCGTFDVRRRQLPIRRPHTGRWVLQIDQQPTWQKTPDTVSVTLVIDVTRRLAVEQRRSEVPFSRLGLVGAAEAR
jgi:hypothetical protein